MALNSQGQAMNHSSHQQSMNAKRRSRNQEKQASKLIESDMIVDAILHEGESKLINTVSLPTDPHIQDHIIKIYNILQISKNKISLGTTDITDLITLQPKKGSYFVVGTDLYEIEGLTDSLSNEVLARKVDYSSSNIQPSETFSLEFVRANIISDMEAQARIVHQIMEIPQNDTISIPQKFNYLDNDGRSHSDIDALRESNVEILRQRYPIKSVKLLK